MIRPQFGFIRCLHPFVICGVLAAVYLLLVLLLPANKASMVQYGWTANEYHMVYMLIVIPMVATWFAAYYGYSWVRSYANSIANTPEGESYNRLANGIGLLALSFPLPAIATLLLNSVANDYSGFLPAAIITVNYITLLLPLIGFVIVGDAARQLLIRANVRISMAGARLVIFLFVALGVMFCFLVLRHFDLNSPGSGDNAFHMPIWVMLVTLIVPYLYAWFIGLLAAYEFSIMASQTRGVLYAQALRLFAFGLAIVIGSSIVLEYISIASPRSAHLELDSRIFGNYIFRITAGIGFLMIAQGARKLRKIEEV